MSIISKIFDFKKLWKSSGKFLPYILLFLSLIVVYYLFFYKPLTEKEAFINLYKDILIIRFITPDTAKANLQIQKHIQNNGLSENDFKKLYNYYSSDANNFLIMIDSAKARAEREILQNNNKK